MTTSHKNDKVQNKFMVSEILTKVKEITFVT